MRRFSNLSLLLAETRWLTDRASPLKGQVGCFLNLRSPCSGPQLNPAPLQHHFRFVLLPHIFWPNHGIAGTIDPGVMGPLRRWTTIGEFSEIKSEMNIAKPLPQTHASECPPMVTNVPTPFAVTSTSVCNLISQVPSP